MSSPFFTVLQQDDVEGLIDQINATPTWDTLNDVAFAFPSVTREHPGRVETIAKTICSVIASPNAPKMIASTDSNNKPCQRDFKDQMNMCLHEMLTSEFSVSDVDEDRSWTAISPTNEFLVAAMISGAAVRTDLCISSPQIGTVTRGLQLPCEEWQKYIESWQQEIYAVHGCLALLVGGLKFYKAVLRMLSVGATDPQNVLVVTLKKIADEKVIKYVTGMSLLQVVIQHAEDGFSQEMDAEEIWHILFPDV